MAFPLTTAVFKARFKAFTNVSNDLVQAKLDEAERDIDETAWGDQAEDGHAYRAADLLVLSGYAGEVSKDGTTSYGRRFAELQERKGRAYRAILG